MPEPELKVGTCVSVEGLTSERGRTLNGKCDVVTSIGSTDLASGRFGVALGKEAVSIKEPNLTVDVATEKKKWLMTLMQLYLKKMELIGQAGEDDLGSWECEGAQEVAQMLVEDRHFDEAATAMQTMIRIGGKKCTGDYQPPHRELADALVGKGDAQSAEACIPTLNNLIAENELYPDSKERNRLDEMMSTCVQRTQVGRTACQVAQDLFDESCQTPEQLG
jgi:hypothetical protein